ncbi:MAG: hypothetical protein AB8B62_16470 [Roseobacter sp.]
MIRALALSLFLGSSALAQTPIPTAVANDLRACIAGHDGFRDATRVGQLDASLQKVPNRRWPNVIEIAPGVHRITGQTTDVAIEIKLRDRSGNAHCLAFGPKVSAGQGALIADRFVELNFLPGLVRAAPGPGMTRRYTVMGAPYQADLIALPSGQGGDMVGFSFVGLPINLTTRALSLGDPTVNPQAVRQAMSNAITICLRNYFAQDTVDAALSQGGFEYGYATGGSSPERVFFTKDNAVSLHIKPGLCTITSNYVSTSETVQLTYGALNASAPGQFEFRNRNHNGCPAFFSAPSLNAALSLNISSAAKSGRAHCNEDGTSQITFVVAG